jgi:hypothetical protein
MTSLFIFTGIMTYGWVAWCLIMWATLWPVQHLQGWVNLSWGIVLKFCYKYIAEEVRSGKVPGCRLMFSHTVRIYCYRRRKEKKWLASYSSIPSLGF